MEIEIPTWLTKDYIRYALQDGKDVTPDRSITVDNIEVDKPIAKGDNYMCEIFRVKTEYRTSDDRFLKTSLIIKAPIKSAVHEMLLKMGVFQKEIKIYNEYIPKINRMLRNTSTLTPKSFFSNEDVMLVLEDLKFQGYVMADRQRQLDFNHCEVALKTLAIYHAASVKLHEEEPKFVEDLGKEYFFHESYKESNLEFLKCTFKLLVEESKSIPQLNRYTKHFETFSKTAWDILVQLMSFKENSFNVLNHGDFWVNNMLFRYDNGKPIDLKLIDFQVARYSSPAIDLLYFFYGSVQDELRIQRMDELLRIYLDQLNKSLETFDSSQRLTEAELKLMIEKSEFFGLFVSVSLYPIVIADPKECTMDMKEVKLEDFENVTEHPFSHFYRTEKYKNALVKRMMEFENKGLF